jgi:hypothetical protein
LLAYIENDIVDYIEAKIQKLKIITGEEYVRDVLLLFEEKGKYLEALLGDYGNIRFYERLKKDFSYVIEQYLPKNDALMPYLVEFRLLTMASMCRLWLLRHKDIPPEEMYNLINYLCTAGISSISKDVKP